MDTTDETAAAAADEQWLAQIEKSVEAKAGEQWEKGRWSEFVKDVVWWLHSEMEDIDDEDAINTAVGLIKYRIKKEESLKHAAGDPPNMKTFRENLEGKGVPAIVCDMLFDRHKLGQQQRDLSNKRSGVDLSAEAPQVKRIRETQANTQVLSKVCVDLAVEKLPVLTPANVDTVRYYGRDGSSEIFEQLVDSQEGQRYYNLALIGPPGTGKSNLVWAVADHIASKKREIALWVSRRNADEEWKVRLFKPTEADKGEVCEVKNCPKKLAEILKLEAAKGVEVLILDALSKAEDSKTGPDGMAAFNWTGGNGGNRNARIGKRRVIHVSSLGSFVSSRNNRESYHLREMRMRPWTRQDFVEAVSDDKLKDQVCRTLGIGTPSTETPDGLVDTKFFYSGVNARWFFNLTIDDIKDDCKEIIERSSPDTPNFGERHAFAVSSAVQSFWYGDRQVKLFTSSYLAHLMGQDKSKSNRFFELFPLMKERLGNGSPGEIFESDFAMHLQHSHDLAIAQRVVMGEKAQKVDVRLGIDISTQELVLWPTGQLHSLPKAPRGALQPMPLTSTQVTDRVAQWFIPEDPSQPFLDLFVLIPEDGGKWQFRAIQNTVSKAHSTDMDQLQRVVGGVLHAGFDLAAALVVAYVIEDEQKQKTVANNIAGKKIKVNNPANTRTRQQEGSTPSLDFDFNIDLRRVVYARTGATPL